MLPILLPLSLSMLDFAIPIGFIGETLHSFRKKHIDDEFVRNAISPGLKVVLGFSPPTWSFV
jgi:hypothetical protein